MKSRVFWVHSHPLTMRMRSTTSYWCTHVTINTKKYVIIVSSLQNRKMYYSTCIHIRGWSPEVSSILICVVRVSFALCSCLLLSIYVYFKYGDPRNTQREIEKKDREKQIMIQFCWLFFLHSHWHNTKIYDDNVRLFKCKSFCTWIDAGRSDLSVNQKECWFRWFFQVADARQYVSNHEENWNQQTNINKSSDLISMMPPNDHHLFTLNSTKNSNLFLLKQNINQIKHKEISLKKVGASRGNILTLKLYASSFLRSFNENKCRDLLE